MIKLYDNGAYLVNGTLIENNADAAAKMKQMTGTELPDAKEAAKGTMAYGILQNHNTSGDPDQLKIKFDCLISHDITYVGIIQTARASGLEKFPIPYVLTNCHNSLCAVGGTINEDDHMFGLTCAQKFGGIYVPPHQAVIHQYAREMMAGCGRMILGSDSHTRYGALGTMAIGEGGGELAKQLLGRTYDVKRPDVIAVYLTGKPEIGVGPQDVALALIGATFNNGYVNNKVLEFVGPGVANLSTDYRIGIDVMTTETTCLSSIWTTDSNTADFLALHGRLDAYKEMKPEPIAYYDGVVEIDLSTVKPMIAMPFHPSNTYEIETLKDNLDDILADVEKRARVSFGEKCDFTLRNKVRDGKLVVDQGIIAGCAGGGYENICAATDILRGKSTGSDKFSLGVYPASTPVYLELIKNGNVADLLTAGAVVKTAFCGPCFGADATPANGALSIRHSTRNFPNREGSKIQNGQLSAVALMDARSIAATAANHGELTAATELQNVTYTNKLYHFDNTIYSNVVYDSKGEAKPEVDIQFGPNIKDWPAMIPLTQNLILRVTSEIHDPVTTTDELIPSGETSSYRSNPLGLAEFTLSRKDPAYVGRAKAVRAVETDRQQGVCPCKQSDEAYVAMATTLQEKLGSFDSDNTGIGSTIYAVKPGDGSAREQAASCQKVLGGWANIAKGYATKRYRSNLINWGMIPFLFEEDDLPFALDDFIYIPNVRDAIISKASVIPAYVVKNNDLIPFDLKLGDLTDDERQIILKGCLINYYKN